MESGCFLLVQVVNSFEENSTYAGLIVENCRFLLKEILDCSLVFINRSANQDVNSLTLTAGSLPDYLIVIPFINLNKGCIFIINK